MIGGGGSSSTSSSSAAAAAAAAPSVGNLRTSLSDGPRVLEILSADYLTGCPDVMDPRSRLGATVESVLRNPVVACGVKVGLCGARSVGILMRAVGPIFITVCCTLVASVCWVFINTVYPYHCTPGSLYGIFHIVLEAFLFQGVAFNYFMAVSTPPGYAPKLTPEEEARLEEEARREGVSALNRVCRDCRIPKPPRAHHCSVCGTCVMKMDHHCPWIGNCVGHYNHRYFYLFLLYMFVGSIYIAVMSFGPFRSSADFRVPWKGVSSRGTIIFVFVITCAVSVSIGLLLAWHSYLVVSAQTTVEFYFNRYKAQQNMLVGKRSKPVNKFDLGIFGNWRYFFGKQRFFFGWLLPNHQLAPGDGIHYPTQKDMKQAAVAV